MAEKAEKPKDKPDGAPPADKKDAAKHGGKEGGGGLMTKTPVLLGGVMLLEAIVLFGGFKFIGGAGAKSASAADMTLDATKDDQVDANSALAKTVEIPLLDGRVNNAMSGHMFLYDVSIDLTVKKEAADRVKKILADHADLIQDRVRTIIAQMDTDKLGGGSEPGLETLRRQIKFQLDEMVGDGLIDEVLITKCIPFRTDY